MILDIKVYVCGCVSCHKVITKLRNLGEVIIETDESTVMKVASESIGIVPVFEYKGNFYNEYQINSMVDSGITFLPEVVKEKIIIKDTVFKKDNPYNKKI